MPRIICISDTHGMYNRVVVPDGDILIHAGDFGARGTLQELPAFYEWMLSHPYKHKILIAGNHDWCFQNEPKKSQAILKKITYLQDKSTEVLGLKIYGSPWQPRFYDWAFNLDRGPALAKVWAKIPQKTDVLVTHGPPFGILDQVYRGPKVGCQDLLERLQSLNVRLHIFGHIHEAYGSLEVGATKFVNCSICDADYVPCNQAVVVDL